MNSFTFLCGEGDQRVLKYRVLEIGNLLRPLLLKHTGKIP